MNIEFLPWYEAGSPLVRCGGNFGCGALLVQGDVELHIKWHQMAMPHVTIPSEPHILGK